MRKKAWAYSLVVSALGLSLSMAPVAAQGAPSSDDRNPGRLQGPRIGESIEMALNHAGDLDLAREQVARLEELKAAMESRISPLTDEMRALREKIREGEVDRVEGYRRAEELRGELITAAAPLRGSVQEILTAAQHRELQQLMWQRRPGAGRPGAAAVRGGIGARGRGVAPGRIPGGRGSAFSGAPGIRRGLGFQPGSFGRGGAGFRSRLPGAGLGPAGRARSLPLLRRGWQDDPADAGEVGPNG